LSRRAIIGAALRSRHALVAQDHRGSSRDPRTRPLRSAWPKGPPYQFPDPGTGEWVGLNIDLANEAAQELGRGARDRACHLGDAHHGSRGRTVRCIFANLFVTPERDEQVDFTEPYDTYGFHIAVAADSPITTLEELNDPLGLLRGRGRDRRGAVSQGAVPERGGQRAGHDQAGVGFTSVVSGQSSPVFVGPGLLPHPVGAEPRHGGAAPAPERRGQAPQAGLARLRRCALARTTCWPSSTASSAERVASGAIEEGRNAWFDRIAEQ
jgi:hypothetical protein